MDNNTILDILFKVKNKKVSSSLTKLFFEENRVESEILNPDRIASQYSSIPIPAPSPANSVIGIMDYHSDLLLTEDTSVSNKLSWNTGSLKNFINPAIHFSYEVQLYDDDGSGNIGNRIYANDPSDWYFFYNSGQLTFFGDNSSHNAVSNHGYHIKVYQYIGSFGAGAGDLNSSVEVSQVAHGLSVGDLIYRDPVTPSYEKAIADGIAPEKSDVIGVVKSVIDVDNFVYQYLIGEFINTGSGFPIGDEGDAIFLSDITPGLMTNIPPNTLGHISKPIGIILEENAKMILFQMRGFKVSEDSGGSVGGTEYDYYVTENDFDDLKSALSNNSYLSVFVPNGTYSAPINPGVNALEVTNAKLVHGETEEGVIIDLNTISDGSSTTTGLKVTSGVYPIIENLLIKDFTVSKSYDIYGVNASYATLRDVRVTSIRNSNASYNGYGIANASKSINISANSCDIEISNVRRSIGITGPKIEEVSHSSVISSTSGYLKGSHHLTNVALDLFTMENCSNITNLELDLGDDGGDGIINCNNLSNINLNVYGTMGRLGVIKDSKNISNVSCLGANEEDFIFNNCKYLSNIEIESEISHNLITGINNCEYLDNIRIKNCLSNPILNSKYINNLHLENNHLGLSSDDATKGHLEGCENVTNASISAVNLELETPPRPIFTVNGVYSCNQLLNIELIGSGKHNDAPAFQHGFIQSTSLNNCNAIGAVYSSFYGCIGLINPTSLGSESDLVADNYNKGAFTSCANITGARIERVSTYKISAFLNCSNISDSFFSLSASTGLQYLFNQSKDLSNISINNSDEISFYNSTNISHINLFAVDNICFLDSSNISNVKVSSISGLMGATNGVFENCINISNSDIIGGTDISTYFYGFKDCENLTNCHVEGVNSTSSTIASSFINCIDIKGCSAKYSRLAGFKNSTQLINCKSDSNHRGSGVADDDKGEFEECEQIDNSIASRDGVNISGFYYCKSVSNSIVGELNGNNSISIGFNHTDIISDSQVNDVKTIAFNVCNNVSNCSIDNAPLCFGGGDNISSINITNCDDKLFSQVTNISNISVDGDNLISDNDYLFYSCENIDNISISFNSDKNLRNFTCFKDSVNISNINTDNASTFKSNLFYDTFTKAFFYNSSNISNIKLDINSQSAGNFTNIFINSDNISNIDLMIDVNGFVTNMTSGIFRNSNNINSVKIVVDQPSDITTFISCEDICNSNISLINLDGTVASAFGSCERIVNSKIEMSYSNSGITIRVLNDCTQITNLYMNLNRIGASTSTSVGFYACNNIVNSVVESTGGTTSHSNDIIPFIEAANNW